jgi:hypothetical protein
MCGRIDANGNQKLAVLLPRLSTKLMPSRPCGLDRDCGTLAAMGSKDKGRKEVKKAPKPKPKPEPAQRRDVFTPAPPPK